MERALERLHALRAQGQEFGYTTFATRNERGYPVALSSAWLVWTVEVEGAVHSLLGKSSPTSELLNQGRRIQLIGNGPETFEQCKSLFLAATQSAISVLTDDVFGQVSLDEAIPPADLSNRVFVVHGHDTVAKQELEIMLGELGLQPIVLHRQADKGLTLIEKFEEYADVGFAFALLTPDDIGYPIASDATPDEERAKGFRARQNVVFEFGFFVGRLGRPRTCCLYKGDLELPSDLSGLVYKRFERSVEEVGYSIRKELRAAGYKLSD